MSDLPAQIRPSLKTRWYEESPGVTSSKRVWGSATLALGLAMKVVFAIVALLPWVPIAEVIVRIPVALGAADGVLLAGSSILGLTTVDNIGTAMARAKTPGGTP